MSTWIVILLTTFVTTHVWAQDVQHVVTDPESCAALSQAETEARTGWSTETQRSRDEDEWCWAWDWCCNGSDWCCDWCCGEYNHHCGEAEKASKIAEAAKSRFVDSMCRRAEQQCTPPPPPPKNKECTPAQKARKLELEKHLQTIKRELEAAGGTSESKIVCGGDLQSKVDQLVKDAQCPDPKIVPVSSEVFSNCDCQIWPSDQPKTFPTIPDSMIARLKPEQQDIAKQKLNAINAKLKSGDASAWKDFDAFGAEFGKFAGTAGGIAVGNQPSNSSNASSQAWNAIDTLMAESLAEKKLKMTTDEGLEPTEPTTSTSSFSGTGQKPSLQTVWDTQQKTDQRAAWKKKAADKKNGISDNPLRGIFAQISSRYTVKSQGLDQFLNTQKGKYSTLKPE